MKRFLALALAAAIVLSLSACASKSKKTISADRETVCQSGLARALNQGCYEGVTEVSELKRHGDTGIGIFEDVDGEMIMLGGKVYKALGDGHVKEVSDSEAVCFSDVTFFDADGTIELTGVKDINTLKQQLEKTVSEKGKNLFYTVKFSATFSKVKVRTEIKQEQPYKPLSEVLKTAKREFEYENIKGTVVGLRCPDYLDGLNSPGWHFHFISNDRIQGGHVLDLTFDSAGAEYDITTKFDLCVSDSETFRKLDLSKSAG